jgi:hypothetical protein
VRTWWVRSAFGLIFGLLFLTLSRAALVENQAIDEPVLDQREAAPLGEAPQTRTGHGALAQSPQRPPKIDPRAQTSDAGPRSAQVALRPQSNGHIISPAAADTGSNEHQGNGSSFLQGYRPYAVGGLLALGGVFGGLCGAGELGCGNSHGNGPPPGPPNPPGPPPHPPHPPVPPGPPPHPPVSPFH